MSAERDEEMSAAEFEAGPGLFRIEPEDPGARVHITDGWGIRRVAGKAKARKERIPGRRLLNVVTFLLGLLDAGLLYVSFAAQYRFILGIKGQRFPSMIEAGMLDLALVIFSCLGIALSLIGKPARAVRVLIVAFAGASAGMNFAAADPGSWRSVVVYTAAPAVIAIVTDQVISVIRRHYLSQDEESAWRGAGRAAAAVAKVSVLILLYFLRAVLAPKETFTGVRRMVLDAAPVPGVIVVPAIETRTDSGTGPAPEAEPTRQDLDEHYLDQQEKNRYEFADAKATFLDKYRGHEEYGDRAAAARVAALIAPLAGLRPGTGRVLAFEELDRREEAERDGNPVFPTKKAAFLSRYRAHPEYGVRAVASRVAAEIAPLVGLQPGTGRTYAGEELNRLEAAASRRELANGAAS